MLYCFLMRKEEFNIDEYSIRFKIHTNLRYRERSVPPSEIRDVVRKWDVIEEDEDGEVLLWGEIDNYRFLHVKCFEPDHLTKTIWVKTAYYPRDEKLSTESNYRKRVRK